MRGLKFSIAALLIALIGYQVNGQNLFVPFYYDTIEEKGLELQFDAEVNYAASRLRNDFMDKFLFGGHIDEDLKVKTFDRLYANNTIGLVGNGTVSFRDYKSVLFKKKPRYSYQISYGYHAMAGGSYGKDVFELAFFGNQGTQGRTMDLNNLQFNFQTFHKLSFGFFDKKSKSSVALSYIHGTNYIDFSLFEGNVVTDANTDNIDLVLDGHFHSSNNRKGFYAPNGWGLGLDFDIIVPIKWFKEKKAFFQIKAQNIGFIRWNENSSVYQKDSVYNYSGFEIDDLFNFSGIFSGETDIMDSLNIREENKVITGWLPASFSFGKIYDIHNDAKFQSIFGIHILTQGGFRPIGYAGFVYKPVKWFYTGAHLMYGGYGQLRGGIQLNFRAKDKYAFHISTNDILGLVSKIGNGRSLQFGMKFDI